ncbi:hypothetical protein [Teredinibacter turnerae]|uniref:hypothetical protein n=1 Tax=Teredinibacter turnerae TaxID=2426 RepID=UPI0003634FFF|nr:hypothetical protein [Teredinibacter turnerae]
MLQSSRLKAQEGALSTIAGDKGGKKVKCSNQALPVYNELVALALSGNYWAGLVVRGIKGLTSGRMNMDNIYIQKETQLAYGRGIFYLVLPGVTATLEDCADGTYVVKSLNADTNYLQMQKDKKKPGLWRISKGPDGDPAFQRNGDILRKDYRSVVVSDRASDDPRDIAKAARNDLIKVNDTIASMVSVSGFDLHHTPGGGGIVGLKPAYKAIASTSDKEITESATLLANTMYKARHIEGVLWFSDWGGSAVLTRAMQILEKEGLKDFKNHAIFLNRPTSSSGDALKLAKDLELKLAGNGGKSVGFRPSEIRGNRSVSKDGTMGAAGFGLSAAGAGFAVAGAGALAGPMGAAVGAGVGLCGAMVFVVSTVLKGIPKFSGKKYK